MYIHSSDNYIVYQVVIVQCLARQLAIWEVPGSNVRCDGSDGRAVASYQADAGSNPAVYHSIF